MSDQPRRFILQAIHPDFGCPAFEAMFVVDQPQDLRVLLGTAADDDPNLEMYYGLDPGEVEAIARRFDVHFDPDGREVGLRRWQWMRDNIPYLVHTGFELPLMLDGRKPFARMGTDAYPPHKHWNEERFDHYVAQGLLHKEVELEPFSQPHTTRDGRIIEGWRTVYYALKGEEWRIAAWKLVSKASNKERWNHTFERLEGMLLGYEEWQNDWWIEHLRKQHHQFGTLLVYVAVTAQELTDIKATGHRSLPPLRRPLMLVTAFSETPEDDEQRRSLQTGDKIALVRFRVKTLPFLELVGNEQTNQHELPVNRIQDLNRLILESIEVV